jgi:Putative auto-transporter adhesin, head GIN domain
MKKVILGLLAISVLITSCDGWGIFDGGNGITGKGAIERTTRDVKDFKSIDLANSANVFIKQGTTFKVEIETHKNIADVVETIVESGESILQNKKGIWNLHYDKLNVYIEMPSVEGITISGSGDIKVETALSSELINLHISGSGNISAEQGLSSKAVKVLLSGSGDIQAKGVTTSEVSAKISGSGGLDFSGTSDKADYIISGSGDIEAKNLKSKAVKALVSGSGGISCHADESLDAEVTGSGNINYSGNATAVKSHTSGSGSISKD